MRLQPIPSFTEVHRPRLPLLAFAVVLVVWIGVTVFSLATLAGLVAAFSPQ